MGETVRRSQAILRMPVNFVDATLVMHDGERSEVIFFVPPGETLQQFLVDPAPFVPVMRSARIVMVARAAIACVSTPAAPRPPADPDEPELPTERQRVALKLRSGTAFEGELRWTVIEGRQRTADHLNNPDSHILVHDDTHQHFVAKAHLATLEELD